MTSTEFARYYRISKPRFEQVVRDITPPPRELRKKRAAATRGGHGKTFIEYDLRLSIALRYLAGGSYLDLMYLHGVGKSSVFHLLWDTLQRVDAALPEFTLEDDIHDLERCKELSAAFARPTATSWAPSRRGTASRSRWSAPATRTRTTRTSSGAARASRRSPSRPHATQTAASATSRWSLRVACTTRGPTAWPARAAAASSAARWRPARRCGCRAMINRTASLCWATTPIPTRTTCACPGPASAAARRATPSTTTSLAAASTSSAPSACSSRSSWCSADP